MRYYASKCHDRLNGRPFDIEKDYPFLCLNPKYKATLSAPCEYILDSGAFQDVTGDRLTYAQALDRQLGFERKLGQEAHAIVSYDRLVDEQKSETGSQFKARVDTDTGDEYVEDTIKAAEYLVGQRNRLGERHLILSCQGTTVSQYLGCLDNILDLSTLTGGGSKDIIGIGGFCILSRSKVYEEQFDEIMKVAIPRIAERGLKRIHIFGMGVFRVLIRTQMMAKRYGIELSYDTSSAEVNATMGRLFSPVDGQLKQVWDKEEKYAEYHPCDIARMNIRLIDGFWREVNQLRR